MNSSTTDRQSASHSQHQYRRLVISSVARPTVSVRAATSFFDRVAPGGNIKLRAAAESHCTPVRLQNSLERQRRVAAAAAPGTLTLFLRSSNREPSTTSVSRGANDDEEGVYAQVVSTLLTSATSIQHRCVTVHFAEWECRRQVCCLLYAETLISESRKTTAQPRRIAEL